MRFNVNLTRTIYDGNSKATATQFAVMLCSIELPFPPTVGLQLFLGKLETITKVIWYVENELFACGIEDYFSEAFPNRITFYEKIKNDELLGFKKIDLGKLK